MKKLLVLCSLLIFFSCDKDDLVNSTQVVEIKNVNSVEKHFVTFENISEIVVNTTFMNFIERIKKNFCS